MSNAEEREVLARYYANKQQEQGETVSSDDDDGSADSDSSFNSDSSSTPDAGDGDPEADEGEPQLPPLKRRRSAWAFFR